jgi:hypothetical protein
MKIEFESYLYEELKNFRARLPSCMQVSGQEYHEGEVMAVG